MTTLLTPTVDVLVIGAGQAGLALGQQLQQTGLSFLIVDRHARVGDSWRQRFDSLTLFTPRNYSALPGLPVSGDPDGYADKDEIADYLESYAQRFHLHLALSTGIYRLEHDDGVFLATTTSGEEQAARAVVLATGAFQQPAVPPLNKQLSTGVVQLTPESYRNPAQTPAGTVLVVGDGATGRQIARELSATHRVLLSTGRPRRVSPDRFLGKSIFWWMDRLGLLGASRDSKVGRYLMRTDPFPGKDLTFNRLRAKGVDVMGRVTGVTGQRVYFAEGAPAEIDVVIWSTGYRDQSDWVAIPEVKDKHEAFLQRGGLSPVEGLYFIGRSWQSSRGSALLCGVGADAVVLTQELIRTLSTNDAGASIEFTADVTVAVS